MNRVHRQFVRRLRFGAADKPVQLAETAVSGAARLGLTVLFPQQLQGDVSVFL